jgi:putative transposase
VSAGNGKTTVVGVDVGIRHLAVLSTGVPPIPNPRALEGSLRALRRVSRELARREPGSGRRYRARCRVARIHGRAANLRRDAMHKLTTSLAAEHGIVVVEQLNVAGMVRNRHLARALSDAGMAERTFACEACGLAVDRDLNAARNLAKLAQDVAQSGWETRNARGADIRPGTFGQAVMKREAGTGCRPDKTGTVGAQAPTAWTSAQVELR